MESAGALGKPMWPFPVPGTPFRNTLRLLGELFAECPFTRVNALEIGVGTFAHISTVKSPVPTALFELFRLMYDAVDELSKQTLPIVPSFADAIGAFANELN